MAAEARCRGTYYTLNPNLPMKADLLARRTSWALALLLVLAVPASMRAGDREDADDDKPILTFSTVGDSRQDPATPDPTSLPLSGQDAHWLQNTKALSRILRSI